MPDEEEEENLLKEDLRSIRESLEDIKEKNRVRKNYLVSAVFVVGFVAFTIIAFSNINTEPVEEVEENKSVNLTDYQKNYVDCPNQYLELCTNLSKMPTEEISFWKKENERLYFTLSDGRAMISTIPSENSSGEFVTIMSAEEVKTAMNSTSQ